MENRGCIGPMMGIRVVELGTHVVVPKVGRAMADCGAEVVKVEDLKGEDWRWFGKSWGIPCNENENAFFTAENSNKKLVAVNLKAEEGKETLLRLIEKADVFLSNIRLKSLEKMGLDYESLKEKFPKLIYGHFTGYGYEGEEASRPGFDMTAFWARSGALIDWVNKGDFPARPAPGIGDTLTSNLLLSGVLMALIGREKTGKGTLVSTSLLGSGIWNNYSGIMMAQEGYDVDFPKSRYAPNNPLGHIYECKDGNWINMAMTNYAAKRETLLKVLGMEKYLDDSRFDSVVEMKKDIRAVIEIFSEHFKFKTRDEWYELLGANDIPNEKLMQYREVSHDKQAWANGYLEQVEFESGNKITLSSYPMYFSEYQIKKITPAGRVGANTEDVLNSIGYTVEMISEMKENSVIG